MNGSFLRIIIVSLTPPDLLKGFSDEERAAMHDSALQFTRTALASAPFFLRYGEYAGRVTLLLSAIIIGLFSFHPDTRYRRLLRFGSSLPVIGQSVRMYQSLAFFAYFETDPMLQRLDLKPHAARQVAFREIFEKQHGAPK